ncbi:MAG: hypothetical protein JXA19_05855 [Anaerolineales bacterium]|nr:hypothetical protein [Anaerolineales bacterium]
MKNYTKEFGNRYIRSILVAVIAVFIIIPLTCVCVFLPLWMANNNDVGFWAVVVGIALYILTIFGGGALLLLSSYYKRKKKLDAIYLPYGLKGENYQLFFRRYTGNIRGKQFEIAFLRGPVLDIRADTDLMTRLAVSQKTGTKVSSFWGDKAFKIENPNIQNANVYALDEAWAQKTFSDPEVCKAVDILSCPSRTFLVRQLSLRPGKAIYTQTYSPKLFGFNLDADQAKLEVETFLIWLEQIERGDLPTVIDEVVALETVAEQSRSLASKMWIIVAIIFAVMFGLSCLIFVGVFLLAPYL